MGYRPISFTPHHIYHICHRGVDRKKIFHDDKDRNRFLEVLIFSNEQGQRLSYSVARKIKRNDDPWPVMPEEGSGYTDLLAFCLMNNHVHLLLRENTEGGISKHLQRTFNGFAKYFNTRHNRTGGLFAGRFRAAPIDGDDHFLHVTRYIHLNPYTAGLVENAFEYPWSSLPEYTQTKKGICHTSLLKEMMKPKEYLDFVNDYRDYARELANIKHLLLDD